MFTVNKATFSGVVQKAENGILHISQDVLGKCPTVFEVYVPKDIRKSVPREGKVIVQDALCYEKDGERHFKIHSPEQIALYEGPNINSHSFTGIMKGYFQVGETKNVKIDISQDVKGKAPTSFLLFMTPSLLEQISIPMEPGDYVQVNSAICYEKEGEYRYKAKIKKRMFK